ncbi:hypothetical protein ACJJTC_002962 [Scirpophaga incertulas]
MWLRRYDQTSNMFQSFLDSIPENRSLMVNELDLPDDVTLAPYVWEPAESVATDSVLSDSTADLDLTVDTDSSVALSRALTDSDVDYEQYRRLKSRSFSDPWDHMRSVLDAFPPGYLTSLNSFQSSSLNLTEEYVVQERIRMYDEELRQKMARFFEEECRVFSPDDSGLLELQEDLDSVDLKVLDSDLDSISP